MHPATNSSRVLASKPTVRIAVCLSCDVEKCRGIDTADHCDQSLCFAVFPLFSILPRVVCYRAKCLFEDLGVGILSYMYVLCELREKVSRCSYLSLIPFSNPELLPQTNRVNGCSLWEKPSYFIPFKAPVRNTIEVVRKTAGTPKSYVMEDDIGVVDNTNS